MPVRGQQYAGTAVRGWGLRGYSPVAARAAGESKLRTRTATRRHAPEDVWDPLPRAVQDQIPAKRIEVYAIDASRIARDVGLTGRINVLVAVGSHGSPGMKTAAPTATGISTRLDRRHHHDIEDAFKLHSLGRTRVLYETRKLEEVNEAFEDLEHERTNGPTGWSSKRGDLGGRDRGRWVRRLAFARTRERALAARAHASTHVS